MRLNQLSFDSAQDDTSDLSDHLLSPSEIAHLLKSGNGRACGSWRHAVPLCIPSPRCAPGFTLQSGLGKMDAAPCNR